MVSHKIQVSQLMASHKTKLRNDSKLQTFAWGIYKIAENENSNTAWGRTLAAAVTDKFGNVFDA
jgi:hypothetical protein